MLSRQVSGLCLALALLLSIHPVSAQVSAESSVKGNLAGTAVDTSGAVVPGAKVTATGPTGSRTATTDQSGYYTIPLLTPGTYTIAVEKEGFKRAEMRNVEVVTNRTTSSRVTLSPGAVAETVEVTATAVAVDTSSTAVGSNLNDTFYNAVPVSRGVAGIFYVSPGVTSGGGSGASNPSISGGSGLENLYVADGVNITDAAFGGLGTFSRVYGSLGTGINLSFVKEVQVKTGGYEPQYGKATGGIVQIVTKSGGRDFHGEISAFGQPQFAEAERRHPDDFGRVNKAGKTLHEEGYDVSAEVGGYVPGARERLFFFGSINPSWRKEFVLAPPEFGLFSRGEMQLRTYSTNYAGKLTFNVAPNHTIESSVFGDPSSTNTGPHLTLVSDNDTVFGKLEYGTRNWVARYNGVFSPTWLVNTSFTWGHNTFDELPAFPDVYNITDRTQAGVDPATGLPLPGQRGVFTAAGYGFFEPTDADTYGWNIDTSKTVTGFGEHTFNVGYRLEKPFYNGLRTRSGPAYSMPGTNADGVPITDPTLGADPSMIGASAQTQLSLRVDGACTACPLFPVPDENGNLVPTPVYLRGDRNDINFPFSFNTEGIYHAAYLNDSWRLFNRLTLNLGVRWEQQRLVGETFGYTFKGEWSPRIGVVFDPFGNRRTKIFGNFGRYTYGIPLDMAERSLTNEVSLLLARWAPEFTVDGAGNRIAVINDLGTVTPVFDAAHLLNQVAGGTGGALFPLGQSTTAIAPGTRLPYLDEWVGGFEQQLPGGVVFSLRYLDRRYKRIVEDIAAISPEATNAGLTQNYVIANVNAGTDLFTNERQVPYTPGGAVPGECLDVNGQGYSLDPVQDSFENTLGAVCFPSVNTPNTQAWFDTDETSPNFGLPLPGVLFGGEPITDGIADGFPKPLRKYQAVEIEANKSFSNNWQMRVNWRIARLFGNFEGAYRNDNGQTDPSISSLFDFVAGSFGLLGDQFRPGNLNTDRRHTANAYVSYVLPRGLTGLTLGAGGRIESGIPINDLKAHPAYLNSGEVPVGGRGVLGRTPTSGSMDVHADYPIRLTEATRLRIGMDMFNIFNFRKLQYIDQNEDNSFGTRNADFLKPGATSLRFARRNAFQRPFYARFLVKFEF